MGKRAYLIAESGRPKDLLEAWRRDLVAAEHGLRDFMREIGAVGFLQFGFEKPQVFTFPRHEAPEGWTKPARNGASRPKKTNTKMLRRIKDLAWCDDLNQLVRDSFNLPTGLSYEGPDGVGSSFLTSEGPNTFSACWTTGVDGETTFILLTPDYEAAKSEGDKVTWNPAGTAPGVPEGFRQITEAEMNLIFAQAKVAREQAAKQKETLASPEP